MTASKLTGEKLKYVPKQVFLRHGSSISRLATFLAYPPNELLFSVDGKTSSSSVLAAEYPVMTYAPQLAPSEPRFNFSDAVAVDQEFDHFSVHGNGQVHIKFATKRRTLLHGPGTRLGKDQAFLLLDVISEETIFYEPIEGDTPEGSIVIDVPIGHEFGMKGVFGGEDFDAVGYLASNVAARIPRVHPGVELDAGNIRGALMFETHPYRGFARRPKGTIVAMRAFKVGSVVDAGYHVVWRIWGSVLSFAPKCP